MSRRPAAKKSRFSNSEGTSFDPKIDAALDRLLDVTLGDGPAPLAVFDADGTLWSGDVGESFFQWLIAEGKLVGARAEGDPWAEYEALCAEDHGKGYASLGPRMAGMAEDEVKALAREHFEAIYLDRIYPAQAALIGRLQALGWEVWIISASNRWIVEIGAEHLRVPAERVVGITVEVEDDLLTEQLVPPVTYRAGKVEAIDEQIGRRPQLVSGNSMTDLEMLEAATALRLVIDPGEELGALAEAGGWLVQRWSEAT